MRSFTKKNLNIPPHTDTVSSELDKILQKKDVVSKTIFKFLQEVIHQHGTDYLAEHENRPFHELSKFTIHLTNSNVLWPLLTEQGDINKIRSLVRSTVNIRINKNNSQKKFTVGDLNGNYNFGNFDNYFNPGNINPGVRNPASRYPRHPLPTEICNALNGTNLIAGGAGLNLTGTFENSMLENLAGWLALKDLVHYAVIRARYKDQNIELDTSVHPRVLNPQEQGQQYGNSKQNLIVGTGLYCGFCESPLSDGGATDVEHKLPKSVFPTEERRWENFVLACKRCNSQFKGTKYVTNLTAPTLLLELETFMDMGPLAVMPTNQELDNRKTELEASNAADRQTLKVNKARKKELEDKNNRDAAEQVELNNLNDTEIRLHNNERNKKVIETIRRGGISSGNELSEQGYFTCNNKSSIPESGADALMKKQFDAWSTKAGFDLNPHNQTAFQYATNNTLWPDLKNNGHISFKAITYVLKRGGGLDPVQYTRDVPLKLGQVSDRTDIDIRIDRISMDLVNPSYADVRLIADTTNAPAGCQVPANNIIAIAGLNSINKDKPFNDQVMIRRTKAWLNAMKQLVILKENNVNIDNLINYYQRQLNPAVINHRASFAADQRSNIGSLVEGSHSNYEVQSVQLPINKLRASGFIDISLERKEDANSVVLEPGTAHEKILPTWGLKGYIQGGEIIGSFYYQYENPVGTTNDWVVSLWQAPINVESGILTIPHDEHASNSPLTVEFQKWEDNRNDLIHALHSYKDLMKTFLWQNILSMVKDGGFYSTWVSTFQRYCDTKDLSDRTQDNDFQALGIRHDLDLVRRLEIEAQSNPNDDFQFHGTDAEQIIEFLSN